MMDLLIAILLLLAGVVIGFFAARYWFVQREQAHIEAENLSTKQRMLQHSQNHLNVSRAALSEIEQQIAHIKEQFDDFEQAIEPVESGEEEPQLTFFGDQASAYLRNIEKTETKKSASSGHQPLDYAGQSSGLFSGKKVNQAETAE